MNRKKEWRKAGSRKILNENKVMEKDRVVWIDYLRVAACFLVMFTHCCEPFYLGGEGTLILTASDAKWIAVLNSIPRVCVPLFVVASSYLLFPLNCSTGTFFRKRASRILVPFIVWTIVYAIVFGEPAQNFRNLLLNFNYSAGHLWFIYMLLGLYLIMPLLSLWAKNVGKRELKVYIAIWLFTTLIPLLRQWLGGLPPVIYGPSGMPNMAKYPLWGECSWNPYGTFYYISGFIGYMLLGLYFRKFVGDLSWKKTLMIAIPSFMMGLTITSLGFLHNVNETAGGEFPVGGTVGVGALWEVAWLNDTIGVALMTIAWLLVFKKIRTGGKFYEKALLPVSKASYGMYLCHMFLLIIISGKIREALGVGVDGVLGIWTTPVEILFSAVISFTVVAVICVFVQKIPKVGKWIIG